MTTFLIIIGVIIILGLLGDHAAKKKKEEDAKDQIMFRQIREEELRKSRAMAEASEKILEQYSSVVKKLVEELIEVGRKYPPDAQSASRYLNTGKVRAREIGKSLDEAGGNELMLIAHTKVRGVLGGIAARELEVSWNGIGEWMG